MIEGMTKKREEERKEDVFCLQQACQIKDNRIYLTRQVEDVVSTHTQTNSMKQLYLFCFGQRSVSNFTSRHEGLEDLSNINKNILEPVFGCSFIKSGHYLESVLFQLCFVVSLKNILVQYH